MGRRMTYFGAKGNLTVSLQGSSAGRLSCRYPGKPDSAEITVALLL